MIGCTHDKFKVKSGVVLYPGDIDDECIELCVALNNIPGIRTDESCSGHGTEPYKIFISVTDLRGLFFLARCVDRRYWRYGHLWKFDISVADVYEDGILPTVFTLHSDKVVGDDAYEHALDLIENINYHAAHENFLKAYDLTDLFK